MKRVLVIAAVFLTFGAVAAQHAADPAAEATAVLRQNARAFETADMKTLDALWAQGLLGADRRADLGGLDLETLTEALDAGSAVAAVTVSRAGADLARGMIHQR